MATSFFLFALLAAVAFAVYVAMHSRSLALPAARKVEELFQAGVIQCLAVTWNLHEKNPRNILPMDIIIEGQMNGEPWRLEGRNGGVRLEGNVPPSVFELWLEWHRHTAEALHCFDLLRARKRVEVADAIDGKPGSLIATPRSVRERGGRAGIASR